MILLLLHLRKLPFVVLVFKVLAVLVPEVVAEVVVGVEVVVTLETKVQPVDKDAVAQAVHPAAVVVFAEHVAPNEVRKTDGTPHSF